MNSYLQLEDVTKSYGDRMLFADVTFGVNEGDKIGLIARNGAGKSTLLSIIAGEEGADSGKVTFRDGIRVGMLEQEPKFDLQATILDALMPAARVHHEWDAEEMALQMLGRLGLHDCRRKAREYSGGQLKRAALARVLLEEPDMLILDEPTNHLDIEMIEWLQGFLSKRRVTLLMVTHDRYFLDNVCNRILELDESGVFSYEGNYDYYLNKRAERLEASGAELARVRNLLRTELDWMRRQPQARGSKAKYRIDNFHDLERRKAEGIRSLRDKNVALGVNSAYIGSKIFEARDVTKAYGDKKILSDWSYDFARFDKVGIVGSNGVGKSTFIKMLIGELRPDSGRIEVGETVKWGYYSQEGLTGFDESKKVIDAVREIAESVRISDTTTLSASQFLTQFLFSYSDQQKYIYKLSGGERRRLYLATVLMRSPNFLVLDEPTNDLDIVTLGVLEEYLAKFKGCVIVVSHDRFFLDRVVDHLFVMQGDGIVKDFPGDYSTYRHCLEMEEKERRINQTVVKPQEKKRERTKSNKLTYAERKEMERLELSIANLYEEKASLEAELSTTTDHKSLSEAGKRIENINNQIDEEEMRLLELMDRES